MQILIIRFSSLGDLVTLEPTFRAFRSLFSNARISFLTSAIGYELYSESNLFDQFIIYENLNSLRELRKINNAQLAAFLFPGY